MINLDFLLESSVFGTILYGVWRMVKKALSDRDNQITTLQNDLKTERDARNDIQLELRQLKMDFKASQAEATITQQALQDVSNRLSATRAEYNDALKTIGIKNAKIEQQNDTIERQNNRIEALVTRNAEISKKLLETKTKRDVLASDKIMLLSKLQDMTSERDTLAEEKRNTLQAVEELNKTINARFDKIESLQKVDGERITVNEGLYIALKQSNDLMRAQLQEILKRLDAIEQGSEA